jgi:signal peptidase I
MMIIDRLARTPLSQILVFAAILTAVRLVCYPYLAKTTDRKGGGYGFVKFLNELSDALIYAAIVVFMLVRPFGVQTFYIPSGSMIDTLHLNDYIAANKFIYRVWEPADGDIVVFKPPSIARGPNPTTQESDFIKRLIGRPGDVIEIRDKKLYRNGQPVDEPYVCYTAGEKVLPKDEADRVSIPDFKLINDNGRMIPVQYRGEEVNPSYNNTPRDFQPKSDEERDRWLKAAPAPIPAGFYLFMGDNRNGSFDSRYWGLVPRESIIGRSEFVWVPFNRWRITR